MSAARCGAVQPPRRLERGFIRPTMAAGAWGDGRQHVPRPDGHAHLQQCAVELPVPLGTAASLPIGDYLSSEET